MCDGPPEKNKYITRLAVGLRCGAPRVPENPLLASLAAALSREGLSKLAAPRAPSPRAPRPTSVCGFVPGRFRMDP